MCCLLLPSCLLPAASSIREMGTSILIFHVSGGSAAIASPAPYTAPCPASSFPASLPAAFSAHVTCQWVVGHGSTGLAVVLSRLASHTANFGASFKTLISRIDNDTETASSSRSRKGSPWVATGQATGGQGTLDRGLGRRIERASERSRALQVLVQRMCAGRDLSLAGARTRAKPDQLDKPPPTQAIHGSVEAGAWRVGEDTVLIHPFAVAVRVCSWLYPVALAGNLFGTRPPARSPPPLYAPTR